MKSVLFILYQGGMITTGSVLAANTNVPVVSGNLYVPIAIFIAALISVAVFVWGVAKKTNSYDNRIDRNRRVADENTHAIKELKFHLDGKFEEMEKLITGS